MDPQSLLAVVTAALTAIDPIIDIAAPEAGVAVLAISKLLAGIAAAEPAALALLNQVKTGAPATITDLQSAIAAYHATDDQFAIDLKAAGAS